MNEIPSEPAAAFAAYNKRKTRPSLSAVFDNLDENFKEAAGFLFAVTALILCCIFVYVTTSFITATYPNFVAGLIVTLIESGASLACLGLFVAVASKIVEAYGRAAEDLQRRQD